MFLKYLRHPHSPVIEFDLPPAPPPAAKPVTKPVAQNVSATNKEASKLLRRGLKLASRLTFMCSRISLNQNLIRKMNHCQCRLQCRPTNLNRNATGGKNKPSSGGGSAKQLVQTNSAHHDVQRRGTCTRRTRRRNSGAGLWNGLRSCVICHSTSMQLIRTTSLKRCQLTFAATWN